jgi:hypothetical protein
MYQIEENKDNIKETISEKVSKPVIQFKGSAIIQHWDSAKQAEKEGGFNSSSIRDVCVGRKKTHRGYKWEYENEDDIFNQKNGNIGIRKPIKCEYDNGTIEEFESKRVASIKLKIKESTIHNILLSKTKQKKEFKLSYL